jgi:hypothetical protein
MHSALRTHRLLSLALGVAAVFDVTLARATDPFEIQVYDGTANAPGVPGLELHANFVAAGLKTSPSPPEFPQNRQTHLTLEPSIGVLPWWELGGYFETALRSDGTFDYAGVKLRSKFVTPPKWDAHFRLGLNVEVSLLPQTFDRDRWGSELRPILAWEDEHWMFVINPIIDTSLAGPDASAGPSFEPAAMALWKIHEVVSVGLEYYANFGPFSGFVPWREQEQYVFEVFNLLSVKNFELNAGVGEGLTDGSNALVFKTILGYAWEREAATPRAGETPPVAWAWPGKGR